MSEIEETLVGNAKIMILKGSIIFYLIIYYVLMYVCMLIRTWLTPQHGRSSSTSLLYFLCEHNQGVK